eukprot:TRINITY_DN9576_c0_g1_i3.p1 TRINITY_DN9576_c0_g1~~TRINITY_DN9576_c0_g1_i3.p1  ORF type:complete len:228 (+),score=37.79 TRINITY_DN9576_c0_g1_i3:76-759(+)
MDSVSKVPEAQNALISLLNEGDLLLSKQQPQNALNVLLQAHEAAMTLYSNQPAGQIPTLTLLGSAHLGCGDVKSAEKCLTQAHWALMKCERPSPSQRHLLHRQLGQLYYLKGMAPEALAHMAEDAFYASEADGTDSLQVGLAYFTMGNLFHTSEDDEKAKVYFHQAAELWYAHLQHVIADEDYSQLDQCTVSLEACRLKSKMSVLPEPNNVDSQSANAHPADYACRL